MTHSGQVEALGSGDGWREERTGLHELESIEVRRHWFTGAVHHDTLGTVKVLNLVESPEATFETFTVHYAETFIVPAAVGPYIIRPVGFQAAATHATVKAWVRGTQRQPRSQQHHETCARAI